MILLVFSLLAAISGDVPEIAGEKEFTCQHSEQHEVSFTSSDSRDTLSIDVLGGDCTGAVAVTVIRNERGYPVFRRVNSIHSFIPYRVEDQEMFDLALDQIRPENALRKAGDFEPYDEQTMEQDIVKLPDNKDAYEKARKENVPVYCYTNGYEYIQCFRYNKDQFATVFFWGWSA